MGNLFALLWPSPPPRAPVSVSGALEELRETRALLERMAGDKRRKITSVNRDLLALGISMQQHGNHLLKADMATFRRTFQAQKSLERSFEQFQMYLTNLDTQILMLEDIAPTNKYLSALHVGATTAHVDQASVESVLAESRALVASTAKTKAIRSEIEALMTAMTDQQLETALGDMMTSAEFLAQFDQDEIRRVRAQLLHAPDVPTEEPRAVDQLPLLA